MRDMGTKESIDNIWERYAKTLKLLSNALDELDKKPKEVILEKLVEVEKEVEVEKIVEVEADVNLNTPEAIAKLEKRLQKKLKKKGSKDDK